MEGLGVGENVDLHIFICCFKKDKVSALLYEGGPVTQLVAVYSGTIKYVFLHFFSIVVLKRKSFSSKGSPVTVNSGNMKYFISRQISLGGLVVPSLRIVINLPETC